MLSFSLPAHILNWVLPVIMLAGRQPVSTVSVVIKNVQPGRGYVVVALFDSRDDFLKKPAYAQTLAAGAGTATFEFKVTGRQYAMAVFQDVNGNQKLDKGLFGIPREPYGFSNNYRPLFSAPSFEDCRVRITDGTIVSISLH